MSAGRVEAPRREAASRRQSGVEGPALTLLHCADLHFGRWAIREQYEALEDLIQAGRHDVVVVSGDVTQRARAGEFQCARGFLRRAEEFSRTIVVPGNHDVAWWRAPLGLGGNARMFEPYRRYLSEDLEPVLRIPGATLVGLNTSQGIQRHTLTWNYRDLSILGHLYQSQVDRTRAEFDRSPQGDLRIVVMHHNVTKGQLSRRFGLKRCDSLLDALAEMGVSLVLCGHDHQEAVHDVRLRSRSLIVSTASATSSHMVRGGRPPAVQSIRVHGQRVEVLTMVWSVEREAFEPGPVACFDRTASEA